MQAEGNRPLHLLSLSPNRPWNYTNTVILGNLAGPASAGQPAPIGCQNKGIEETQGPEAASCVGLSRLGATASYSLHADQAQTLPRARFLSSDA
jgi:hypothetical protein